MTAMLAMEVATSWKDVVLGVAGLGFSGFILWLFLR